MKSFRYANLALYDTVSSIPSAWAAAAQFAAFKTGCEALLLEYAKRVWDTSSSTWVEIAVVHMTPEHAQYWDAVIQPAIRTIGNQERREGKKPSRVDHHWSWPRIRVLLPLAQSLIKRRCRALTVLLQRDLIWQEPWEGPPKIEDEPKAIPAAMILLIESYPWLLPTARKRPSNFTWFIAPAPPQLLP